MPFSSEPKGLCDHRSHALRLNDLDRICFLESTGLSVKIIFFQPEIVNSSLTISVINVLVEEFHTNRTTLQTEFKKYTGKSINQYLVQLRMSMAAKMLRDTTLSLKEISDRTGFSDVSYFSKAFKAKLNLTPSGYRDIHQAKAR